jgi:hypothetical protein
VLWEEVSVPMVANTVSVPQISDIINQSIFDVNIFVTEVRNPLEPFELDDTHIYTRDVTVMQVIDDILDEFDDEFPIIPNDLALALIPTIVEQLNLCENPFTVSTEALEVVHPVYRRIDFHFPHLMESIFSETADQIPMAWNSSSIEAHEEIVLCLDTPEDPLRFYDFPLRDVEKLEILEAPPDSEADLTGLANTLLELILRTDVVPFVPIFPELDDHEITQVLGDMVGHPTFSNSFIGGLVSGFRVNRIGSVSGPVRDVPRLIRPENVIARLLWDFLLPELPIRPAEYDELIAEAVDELDIEPEELSSEEAFPTEVAELLRLYGGRSPH